MQRPGRGFVWPLLDGRKRLLSATAGIEMFVARRLSGARHCKARTYRRVPVVSTRSMRCVSLNPQADPRGKIGSHPAGRSTSIGCSKFQRLQPRTPAFTPSGPAGEGGAHSRLAKGRSDCRRPKGQSQPNWPKCGRSARNVLVRLHGRGTATIRGLPLIFRSASCDDGRLHLDPYRESTEPLARGPAKGLGPEEIQPATFTMSGEECDSRKNLGDEARGIVYNRRRKVIPGRHFWRKGFTPQRARTPMTPENRKEKAAWRAIFGRENRGKKKKSRRGTSGADTSLGVAGRAVTGNGREVHRVKPPRHRTRDQRQATRNRRVRGEERKEQKNVFARTATTRLAISRSNIYARLSEVFAGCTQGSRRPAQGLLGVPEARRSTQAGAHGLSRVPSWVAGVGLAKWKKGPGRDRKAGRSNTGRKSGQRLEQALRDKATPKCAAQAMKLPPA